MAGTCEDNHLCRQHSSILVRPNQKWVKELMEGTDAFTEEIENDVQERNEPRPIFKAATPDNFQKFKEKNLRQSL